MTSATGSQSYIAILKQNPATPSVIPATPVMQKVNFVSDSLTKEIETKVSDHIRPDRMTSDSVVTGITNQGGYQFELTYENSLNDDLLAAFLWADGWSVGGTLAEIVKNGAFYQPYFIERGHTDIDQYFKFVGMAPNMLSLEFKDQSMVTGEYKFVGLSSQVDATVETGATYTDQTSNPVFSTVTAVSAITIGGVVQTSCKVKEMSLEINNNVTPKTGIGVLGACSTNPHRLDITGKLTMYFEDATMYNRLQAATPFSLSWTLTDGDSNQYIITLPKLKLSGDQVNVSGVNDDVMENAEFVALYDSATDCMIQIERTT